MRGNTLTKVQFQSTCMNYELGGSVYVFFWSTGGIRRRFPGCRIGSMSPIRPRRPTVGWHRWYYPCLRVTVPDSDQSFTRSGAVKVRSGWWPHRSASSSRIQLNGRHQPIPAMLDDGAFGHPDNQAKWAIVLARSAIDIQ